METLTSLYHAIPGIEKGGPILIPIYLGSVLALAIFFERLWILRSGRVVPEGLLREITALLSQGNIKETLALCENDASPLSRVLIPGLEKSHERRRGIREALEGSGRREALELHRHLGALGTIAGIEPLLGLLGTVSGMIHTFNVITTQGVGNPNQLAGGISEALITTAAGLTIAIPTYIAYRYLQGRATYLLGELEEESLRLLPLLEQAGGVEDAFHGND